VRVLLGVIFNVPYLTPQELPEGDDCRPLVIPANSEWLALFGGALTELTKTWNWEDSGGLTVDETVDKMIDIITAWYADPCGTCLLPEGGAIIRVGEDGHLEVLQDGDWIVPTSGDYYIPPPEAREGGTSEDQICLAVKNAVNAIHELYDIIADAFDEDLTAAAALVPFIAGAVALIGFEFAPITFALAQIIFWVWQGLYQALSYLTADLWTEDFSKQIECFLIDCATNTEGVVTFDWECFMEKLNSLANDFALSEVQIRLYLQFGYILQFLGGVDALNLAGGSTAITDDDCSYCIGCDDFACDMVGELCENVYIADIVSNDIFILPTYPGSQGDYVSSGGVNTGEGYVGSVYNSGNDSQSVMLLVTLPTACHFESAHIGWWHNTSGVSVNYMVLYDSGGSPIAGSANPNISAIDEWYDWTWFGAEYDNVKYVAFYADVVNGQAVRLGSFEITLTD